MNRKLTPVEARALRFLSGASGLVTVTDGEINAGIKHLMATPFLSLGKTTAGYEALREYEREHGDEVARNRIAAGMSKAARRALDQHTTGGEG